MIQALGTPPLAAAIDYLEFVSFRLCGFSLTSKSVLLRGSSKESFSLLAKDFLANDPIHLLVILELQA